MKQIGTKALIEVFKKYDNVYTSMNLDNQPEDLRVPPQLPEDLSVKLIINLTKLIWIIWNIPIAD